jgi:hypothetical protein
MIFELHLVLSKTDKSKRRIVCFGGKVLTDNKSAFFPFRSILNPTCLDFLAVRTDLVRKRCGGKLGWSDLSNSCQKLSVKYYNTLTISRCACEQRWKNHKKIIQTIMTSTRSSDYAAIWGGGNGDGSRSQLSRRLARGPPPGGAEEEDNNSTPVAFDVNDGDGGKVEVNGECKGNSNSNGPIDNNSNDD